jgi:hypothetical protein
VRSRGQSNVSDLGQYFVEQAEVDTGIKKQQVSKWANRLKDKEKYRVLLFGAFSYFDL